jgi:DNA polymerase III delta prime subunit
MNDSVETHDHSKLEQCQEPRNVCPKRSLPEIMCPQTLGDLTLPRPMIERLQKMIETKSIMNMLFYGKVGTGKTSAARLFEDSADLYALCRSHMFVQWGGSSVKDADIIRKDITESLSFVGFKICFLDGADLIPKAAQQALPGVIDKWSDDTHYTRFLLAVNDLSKIIPEIRSRLMPISFDIEASDRDGVQKRLIARYESKLAECGIPHDEQRLMEIIGTNYPDLRSIAQKVDFEFA